MDIAVFSSKRDTLQNNFLLHHGVFSGWDTFPGHQLHICMIKYVFHLCSKTKKRHLSSHNATSMPCKDLVRAGMAGKRLLAGGQQNCPLENFPRCCKHEVALSGCTACKSVWAHWAVLKAPNPNITSFYQFLVFQSKMAKWLGLLACLSDGESVSHQWHRTLTGQRRFGISALSCTLSCNSILKISGKLGAVVLKRSPGLQLQHRFRCVSAAQRIVLLENRRLQAVIPFTGNGAEWLQAVPRAALQICLWVCWPLPFENREALGSWGQTQT